MSASSGWQATNQTAGTTLSGNDWRSIASSGSGKYLAIVVAGVDIYTSSDYGTHWKNKTSGTSASGLSYNRITISNSGQYLAATTVSGDIWTSADYGAHWTNRTSSSPLHGLNWQYVISSYTGKYIAATAYTDGLFVSSDYGAHWTSVSSGTVLDGMGIVYATVSSNGKYLTANEGDTNLYGSQDYGATWTKLTTGALDNLNWYGVTASSDGKHVVGSVLGGDIYTSNNYGATWTNRTTGTALSGLSWVYMQSSPSGQFLVSMINSGGGIYTSRDFGASWSKLTTGSLSSLYWVTAAISATGQHIAAAVGNSDIYNFNDPSLAPPNPTTTKHSSTVTTANAIIDVPSDASQSEVSAIISAPSHVAAVAPPVDTNYLPKNNYSETGSKPSRGRSKKVLALTLGSSLAAVGLGLILRRNIHRSIDS